MAPPYVPSPHHSTDPPSRLRAKLTLVVALLSLLAVTSEALAAQPPDIEPPRLVKGARAELPQGPDAPAPRDADVELLITIDETGAVTEVEVTQGVGDPWDQAAKVAVSRFVFTPATVNGTAVAVKLPYTYRYQVPRRRGRIPEARQDRRDAAPTPGHYYVGQVVEKGTRKPLPGITVVLDAPASLGLSKGSWETVTDMDGRFAFTGLPGSDLKLSIPVPEYKTLESTVTPTLLAPGAQPPQEAAKTYYLNPSRFSRYQSVVRENRKRAAAEILLTEDEITRVPGTFGDPSRVVATLPGVARSPFGLGYYVVRGANFENTGFFIDGHPALFLYHLLGGPGIIHPELIGSLAFYPAGYPVDYGRFAGGAINLTTKSPPRDRWHLDVEIDLFRAAALFSIPFDDAKGQVTVSIRRSYYELILPLVQPDISLDYVDYQLRVEYDIKPELRWEFVAIGAEDSLTQKGAIGDGTDADRAFGLGFHRLRTGLDWDISKELTWSNSLAWEFDHTENRRIAEGDDPIDTDVAAWFIQHRTWLDWTPQKRFSLKVGVDTLYLWADADLQIPSLPPFGDPQPPAFDPIVIKANPKGPYTSIAPFVSADWELVDGLRLLPGLRLNNDIYSETYHPTVDPRLAVRWEFVPGWTVKAMTGLAHQPPAVFQYEEPFGDPEIGPVEALQTSFGFEWVPTEGWEISVEGFYNYLTNLAAPSSALTDSNGEVSRLFWRSDIEGRAYGVEVLIRKQVGDWAYGWLSYTLSRAERLRPPDDWALFSIDQTHVLNLAWTFELGNEWSLGARFTLTTGNPTYEILGSRYDADRDRYQPIYSDKVSRIDTFHRLDLRLDKRWRFEDWMLEFYLDIQNVYNATNPESPRYNYDFSIKVDGISLPILPTFGLRAVF